MGKLERYGKIDELIEQMLELVKEKTYPTEKELNKALKECKQYCTEIEANEVRRLYLLKRLDLMT